MAANKWFISSYPRCGTHMLVTALNNHSALTCHAEIFNPKHDAGKHGLTQTGKVLDKFWPDANTGFAAHAYIARRGGAPGMTSKSGAFQDFWKHIPGKTRIVSLRRQNLLARFVSHMRAKQTKLWNVYDNEPQEQPTVEVNIHRLTKDIAFVRRCWEMVDRDFSSVLVVQYEDLTRRWDAEIDAILKHINAPAESLSPLSVKLNRLPLRNSIKNFDEVSRVVSKQLGHPEWLEE